MAAPGSFADSRSAFRLPDVPSMGAAVREEKRCDPEPQTLDSRRGHSPEGSGDSCSPEQCSMQRPFQHFLVVAHKDSQPPSAWWKNNIKVSMSATRMRFFLAISASRRIHR